MKRLDILITEKGLAKSRTAASALIKEGSVTVNGKQVPGTLVPLEKGCREYTVSVVMG